MKLTIAPFRSERLHRILERTVESPTLSVLLFIAYFMPQEYAIGAEAFKVWQLVQMGIFLGVLSVLLFGKCRITGRWALLSLLYASFYIISSAVNGAVSVLGSNIYECLRGIGFITLSELYIQMDSKKYVKSFAFAGIIMCSAHMVSEVLISTGITGPFEVEPGEPYRIEWMSYYLLTYDNESIYFFLPTILSTLLYGINYNVKIARAVGFIMLLLSTALAIYHKAATAVASYILILVIIGTLLVLRHTGHAITGIRPSKKKVIIFVTSILALSGVLVLLISSGYLGGIAELFGKDSSFSLRDEIWRRSIESIASHPLFGRGREGIEITRQVIGQSHCHNIVLELLYTGGAMSLVIYILSLGACCPEMRSADAQNSKLMTSLALIFAFSLGYFLAASFDWYPAIPVQFFIFEALCMCSSTDDDGAIESACANCSEV